MELYKSIIKSSAQEITYRNFMLRYETYSLALACIIGSIYMLIFLTIDYWRAGNFMAALVHRSAMIMVLVIAAYSAYRFKFKPLSFYSLCVSVCTVIFLISISMDFHSGMPQFFLPNFFCLLFYVFNAGLGHPLRLKSIHSGSLIILYLIYSKYYSPHQTFHLTQIWNVGVNVGISLLIGYLIERYKRLNFVQREELVTIRGEMEEMNSMKSKLISIISHDLKSPLNNLKSLLNLNERGLLTPDELKQNFSRVGKSVDGISYLLQNLVRWSKSQHQGFKPELEKIEVRKSVDDVLYSTESISAEKNIQIHNKVEENIFFLVDREMIKLVIRNILTNSIKFSHPNSSITITSKNIGDKCTVAIQDSGIGMTQEEMENLFYVKKSSRPGTQNEGGTGIGLMLTHEFIKMMKGAISVNSEIDKGSTFYVTLPLAKA
jgi:signal transduction histidine kinase